VKARRSREVGTGAWAFVADPYQLARWWPHVARVEGVTADGWTTVLSSPRGQAVRADWRLVASDPPRRRRWEQELEGTPFSRFLEAHAVEVRVDGPRVTIEIEQRLRGWARFAPFLVKRAARQQAGQALDALSEVLSG